MRGNARLLVPVLAAAAALAVPAGAWAHAIMSPPVALKGKAQQFTLSVPTEKEGTTTTQIELTVPSGFGIDSFEPPAAGWKMDEQTTGTGENTVVQKVTWTGGHVPTDQDAVFRFNASADSAKTYTFGVRQTYAERRGRRLERAGVVRHARADRSRRSRRRAGRAATRRWRSSRSSSRGSR